MSNSPGKPLIGVVSDRRMQGLHPFHMVGEKYLRSVIDASDGYPVCLPSLQDGFDVTEILDRLDGLVLTGSPSMLEPHHYDGEPSQPDTWHDPERDAAALDLIPAALHMGMPLLAICRGFQEMNVVYGGSLHQELQDVSDEIVHHENPDDPVEVQYGPAHKVSFTAGGMLSEMTGLNEATVNSIHHQGVDRLGQGLIVEATAEDGLVEAFTVANAPGYVLAIQWHPEWKPMENAVSRAIFRSFGDACRAYSQ